MESYEHAFEEFKKFYRPLYSHNIDSFTLFKLESGYHEHGLFTGLYTAWNIFRAGYACGQKTPKIDER